MGDGSLHAKGIRLCVANTDPDVIEMLKHGREAVGRSVRTCSAASSMGDESRLRPGTARDSPWHYDSTRRKPMEISSGLAPRLT